jgi:hypothetical protein
MKKIVVGILILAIVATAAVSGVVVASNGTNHNEANCGHNRSENCLGHNGWHNETHENWSENWLCHRNGQCLGHAGEVENVV